MSKIIDENGDLVILYKNVLNNRENDVVLKSILKHYGDKFQSDHPVIHGIVTSPKRKTVQISESGILYRYNGSADRETYPFSSTLMKVKRRVEGISGETYNYALINYYGDGDATIGEHSDNEKNLVRGSGISSLSIGETRYFYFRHREDKDRKIGFDLENGDLLIMRGTTQKHWKHAVPKRANKKERINITFRNVCK